MAFQTLAPPEGKARFDGVTVGKISISLPALTRKRLQRLGADRVILQYDGEKKLLKIVATKEKLDTFMYNDRIYLRSEHPITLGQYVFQEETDDGIVLKLRQ